MKPKWNAKDRPSGLGWIEDDGYDVHKHISLEREHEWKVLHFSSHYRCLLRAELTQALMSAGFIHVEWLAPSMTGYYQPVVVGYVPQGTEIN